MSSVKPMRLTSTPLDPSSRGRIQLVDLLGVNEAAFSNDSRLDRVRQYVEENYPERILLADAAQVAGMERTAFSDLFRRKTGIRFREWLAAFRVTQSMELLSENHHSMKKVARKVGYDNLRSFERVFLRFVGRSPSEYRNAARPSQISFLGKLRLLSYKSKWPPRWLSTQSHGSSLPEHHA